ncbi:MAG: GntR family transcriptional regulator [Phycisphaerales bacterium]
MPKAGVYTKAKDIIRQRVLSGEFLDGRVPGERSLAEETGVSYMTVRKAVRELVEDRVLTRRPGGSLQVHPDFLSSQAEAHLVLLAPSYPSPHLAVCRSAIVEAAHRRRIAVRTFEYRSWYDSVVHDASTAADGLIVVPSTEPLPDHLVERFRSEDRRVLFFDADLSHAGLLSVSLFPEDHIKAVLDHLWDLGHREINCLNTQGHHEEIARRVRCWSDWLASRGAGGQFWNHPVPPFEDAMQGGHRAMSELLDADIAPGAVICTTYPSAVGAIRACWDRGLEIGTDDLAIAAMNLESPGRFGTPAITGLEFPLLDDLLAEPFDWFCGRTELIRRGGIAPGTPRLFIGETTAGRAIDRT